MIIGPPPKFHGTRDNLVVIHWTGGRDQEADGEALAAAAMQLDPTALVDVIATPSILVRRGAVVARVLVRGGLTHTGLDLDARWLGVIDSWKATQTTANLRKDATIEPHGQANW